MKRPPNEAFFLYNILRNKNVSMKKLSLASFIVLSALAGQAQDTTQTIVTTTTSTQDLMLRTPMEVKTRFGIKAGANLARFHVSDDEYPSGTSAPESNGKTSIYGGVFVNIPLGGMFRFQPELLINNVGSKISETVTGRNYSYEEDLHYISFPLMFQLQKESGFFVEAGPQLSFLTKARTQGTTSISTVENTDIKFKRDKFDLAIGAGLGYLSRVGVGINARYNFGVTNVIEEGNSSANPMVGELKNRVVQIGLSYHFGANK